MGWVLALGVATTLIGIAGLGLCIARAAAVRKLADPDVVRARLRGLVALNMAAVGVAFFGLALVVMALFLRG